MKEIIHRRVLSISASANDDDSDDHDHVDAHIIDANVGANIDANLGGAIEYTISHLGIFTTTTLSC